MDKNEKNLKLLKQLEGVESFTVWRDWIVKPAIEQLENELNSKEADLIPEAVLRAKIKHISSLKYFFYDVFKHAKNIELK